MSMLTLQVLGLLLLFGLIGAFVGWLIRPFFCKSGSTLGKGKLSGSAGTKANTKMGKSDASIKTSVDTSYSKSGKASGKNKKTDGGTGKATAAAAGIAAAAATAAVVASGKKDNTKKAAIDADKKKLAAEAASARKAEQAKANAEQDAAKKAEIAKKAEEQRAASKKANDAKLAEEQRVATEKANAAKLAEEQRVAAEKASASKQAEEQRIAAEKAKAAKLAEEQRLATEQAQADKAAAIEADKKKLAAEAQTARDAEAQRLAAEKAAADQAAKDAAAKAETDKLAAEKAEADRLAAEKAAADQAAKDAAAKAEADRLAAEKAAADQAAKDAAAKAEADKLAAEKAAADQAAKDAAAKTEADKLAAEKEATESSNAAKLAAAGVAATAAVALGSNANDDLDSVTDDMRPEKLSAPRGGKADDLKRIKGIGPVIEGTLNEEGVYHFQQVADFTPDNVKWVDKNVSIPGRVKRDDWMGQAQSLIDGREYDGYAKDIAGTDDPSLPPVTEDMRPAKLAGAIDGKADDLKRIKGIGPVIEKTLNNEGIYHFKQIADFTPDNVNWVDRHISFPGRISREEWIRQAKGLAAADGIVTDDLSSVTDDMRPEKLSAPRGGKADDLKRIKGVGPVIEGTLNEEGVYHFQQIADFTPDNVKWVDKNVSIPGRVHRDDWMGQAQSLIDGHEYDGYAKDIAGTEDPSLPVVTDDMRPAKLSGAIGGKADDLKRINGIGPVIEKTLNNEGIYHFKQIADFTPDNVNWVDRHISFPGRITREEWIRQAKGLAAGENGGSSASNKAATDDVVITEDMRPARRSVEAGQRADDLKVINGIGPVIEKSLNEEGVHFYQQIADFNEDNTKWVDNHMAFPGRIHREDWIGQAKVLVGQKGSNQSTGDSGSSATAPETIVITDDMRPTRQTLGATDKADDLKVINGVGPVIEKSLNAEGIYFYQQIADFNEDNTKWVDNHMAFPGRIHRENWIAQAKVLVGQKTASKTATAAPSAVGSGLGSSGAVSEHMKPTLLSAPEGGKADDLKRIKGIGKVLEKNLHGMGIYHYEQLAELSDENITWLTDYVSFPEGRIVDENWTGQAKALAEGKQTEYSQRFDKGDTPYKK